MMIMMMIIIIIIIVGESGFREREDEQRLRNASHADFLPLDPFRLN